VSQRGGVRFAFCRWTRETNGERREEVISLAAVGAGVFTDGRRCNHLLCDSKLLFTRPFIYRRGGVYYTPRLCHLIDYTQCFQLWRPPPLRIGVLNCIYDSNNTALPVGAVIGPGNPFFEKDQNNLVPIRVTNPKGGFTPIQAIYGLQNPGTYIYCFFAISVDPHFGVNMTA